MENFIYLILLISKIGGIDSAVNNPGQMIDGQTVFILMLSLSKWPFENYFKAGNYLVTTEPTAFSYIKYYNLNVTH